MDAVKIFFAENPEATECFEALGYIKATQEEANAVVGGTTGQVTKHEREAGKVYENLSDELLGKFIACEDAEADAQVKYEELKTEEAMQAWVAAKKSTDAAKAAFDKQVKKENKAAIEKAGDAAAAKQITADGVELVDHVVTEEDLAHNPEMVDEGIKAGDTIQIPINLTASENGTETPGGHL